MSMPPEQRAAQAPPAERSAAPAASSAPVSAVAYDRQGSGPPLMLLHPLGLNRRVWDPVLPLLVRSRDVITIDLPGFGASPPLEGVVPDPAALARAVARLLAELELDGGRAHVAGCSLGGWVALELAACDQAASVTAIAPAGLWSRPLAPKPELTRWLARLIAPAAARAMRSRELRRLALSGSVARPQDVPAADAAGMIRSYGASPGFSAVNRAMRANVFSGLDSIAVPVTLVWPELDRVVTRARNVPAGVREVVLRGCGHVPMWDDRAAVAELLLSGSEGL
jgi:pimeloyl-ACP methyl ester carboxylesterase